MNLIIPKIISGVLTLARFRKKAAVIDNNPKATNGGIITIIVVVVCMYAESIGIGITPEMQGNLTSLFGLVGTIYTAWRASR